MFGGIPFQFPHLRYRSAKKFQIGGSRSVPCGDGLAVDDTPSRARVTIANVRRIAL
jgi:hypothetical protein